MDLKRVFRSWVLAILVVFVLLVVVLNVVRSGQGYTSVPTSQVASLIYSGHVKSVVFNDNTQVVQIVTSKGRWLQGAWVQGQGTQLAQRLDYLVRKGALPAGVYKVNNPQGNSLLSVLLGWLPFIV